jgi:opacity protein-like surface antigen
LYIQPSYAFNNSSSIFAKVAYNFAKGSLTETGTDYTPTSFTASKNIEGWGYGFGVRSLITNNIYVQAEAQIDEYDKETSTDSGNGITYSFDPKVVRGKISVGYKF